MPLADWHLRSACWSALACAGLPLAALALMSRAASARPLVGVRVKATGAVRVTPGGILVHGVSLGEVNLLRALRVPLERASGLPVVASTSTDTGWQGLANLLPTHERVFFPFDLPWAVEAFLDRVAPRLVVLLESELWPGFLCACHRRGIPVVGVNTRVSERSFQRLLRIRPLITPFFAERALWAAQNATYAQRLLALGADPARVVVTGSMKADMVHLPAQDAVATWAVGIGLDARPLLLLASTSPDEEATVLAGGLAAWSARGWRIAIAPRHPERGAGLAALVAQLGGQPRRLSLGERLGDDLREVLIADVIGRLGHLYAHCATGNGLSIVGGSLGSGRGGQNMLESAAAGACTVVGWDTRSQPDAMALLRQAEGVLELRPGQLEPTLSELASDPTRRLALGAAGRNAWQEGQGATARTLDALQRTVFAPA